MSMVDVAVAGIQLSFSYHFDILPAISTRRRGDEGHAAVFDAIKRS
jgi:hypothetical protein